jgi:lipopolysaccharide/colanic/teichoic acid biosynthesis glycosyltransferase
VSTINLGPFESSLLGDSRTARAFSLPETVERAAGFLFLAAAAPAIATSAVAVAALSRRSPFIAHLRVAKKGKPFWMLKLRTMWPLDEAAGDGRAWIERQEVNRRNSQILQERYKPETTRVFLRGILTM